MELSSIGPVVSEEKMFENVDGRTTDAGVIGILIAHLGAFGSGELKITQNTRRQNACKECNSYVRFCLHMLSRLCLSQLSPSYTVTILAKIHHDLSRFEPDGKIGIRRDGKKKIQHQYGVSRCSYGVCTIHLQIHYDS